MNKVVLLGRMVADPELRTTQGGNSVTTFTVAVDRPPVKDKERETDWIDVVAWRGTAEFICRYFGKGSPIILEGTLQSRNWEDKNGNKRKSIEVLATNVEFVPKTQKAETQERAPEQDDFAVIEDEDLPF